ncbi:MAG: hypothetical protein AABW56_04790 [Nanoarchaeota archaeon]
MGFTEWFYGLFQRKYNARSATSSSKISDLKMGNYVDSAKREASVLKTLKKNIYLQDQTAIQNSLNLFDNLGQEQEMLNTEVAQLISRISNPGVRLSKRDKDVLNKLKKEIIVSKKAYDGLVEQNRNHIERIKASIKDNDFGYAEMQINQALRLRQSLNNSIKILGQKKQQVDRILERVMTPAGP